MMQDIFKHAEQEAPRECCGLVIEDGDNKKYIRMENIFFFFHGLKISDL